MSAEMNEHFKIISKSPDCKARLSQLKTNHGTIDTPVFLPVASQGSVKALTSDDLKDIGVTMLLSNTYHLYLRPGIETIGNLGGLHKFMRWDRPILTDSGGYQIFSLTHLCKITEDGAIFRSHIDGSQHFISPEMVINYQEKLGVDIMMVLDECISSGSDRTKTRLAMQRTHDWAGRSKKAQSNQDSLLFAIIQGGLFPELRRLSSSILTDMDFPGYAIGGLSLGESKNSMWEMVEITTEILPEQKPRYLMGVGSPEDLVKGISLGIDIFDCALPTRVARNGALFTNDGRIDIYKSIYKTREAEVDIGCDCYTCRHYSSAYLHHLFKAGELLAFRLATIHNLRYLTRLVTYIKEAIKMGQFSKFADDFNKRYKTTNESVRTAQKSNWIKTRLKSTD
jgi:queuine tRNA-ribosyltransferase